MLGRLLVATLALAFAAGAAAQALPERFDPARDAAQDLAVALERARASGRHVLVDVGGEWCPWCHVLDRFFAANVDLAAQRDRSFVWLKVNVSKENRNERVLSRWPKVAGYPHLFVLDGDGSLLHSQNTGELEAGKDYDLAAFRAFLARYTPASRAR
jgi:thiol:disulfide interchange protein